MLSHRVNADKERQISYDIIHMQNLKKMVQMNFFLQNRSRDTEAENKQVMEERDGGINWEIEIDIYTLLCIK